MQIEFGQLAREICPQLICRLPEEIVISAPIADRLRGAFMLFHKQPRDRISIRREKQRAYRAVESGEESLGVHLFVLTFRKSTAKKRRTRRFFLIFLRVLRFFAVDFHLSVCFWPRLFQRCISAYARHGRQFSAISRTRFGAVSPRAFSNPRSECGRASGQRSAHIAM